MCCRKWWSCKIVPQKPVVLFRKNKAEMSTFFFFFFANEVGQTLTEAAAPPSKPARLSFLPAVRGPSGFRRVKLELCEVTSDFTGSGLLKRSWRERGGRARGSDSLGFITFPAQP